MLTFLFDDVGIPLDYRHMPGFGVHTFKLINREGRETFVKFHWKPTCGEESLLDEDAVRVGGTNHAHAQADLFESIEEGNFPEWTLYIQTMEIEDQLKVRKISLFVAPVPQYCFSTSSTLTHWT